MSSEPAELSFRIMGVGAEDVELLRNKKPGLTHRLWKNGPNEVVTFSLLPGDVDWLVSILLNRMTDVKKFDIFVSLVTESDSWIIELPGHAIELIRATGCGVSFSATIV